MEQIEFLKLTRDIADRDAKTFQTCFDVASKSDMSSFLDIKEIVLYFTMIQTAIKTNEKMASTINARIELLRLKELDNA